PSRHTVYNYSASPVAAAEETELPGGVTLAPNYPNPFNPATTIAFSVPRATPVRLTVHDALGRHVATLVDAVRPAGRYELRVDLSGLPSGVYFYRLSTAGFAQTRQ